MAKRWMPPEGLIIKNDLEGNPLPQLEWHDWCRELFLAGLSIRTVSQIIGTTHWTIRREMKRDPELEKIYKDAKESWGDLILEKTVELVLGNKPCHPAFTIFLLKALTNLTDQPQHKEKPDNDPAKKLTLVPAMTSAQAKEYIQRIRIKHSQMEAKERSTNVS